MHNQDATGRDRRLPTLLGACASLKERAAEKTLSPEMQSADSELALPTPAPWMSARLRLPSIGLLISRSLAARRYQRPITSFQHKLVTVPAMQHS